MCGENLHWRPVGQAPERTIPACAGRTEATMADADTTAGPSPRVRGEHMVNTGFMPLRGGLCLQRLLPWLLWVVLV